MPNAEARSPGSLGIRHSTFVIDRRSWITAALLFLTIIYAVLQVGFVRPHLPAETRLNLARPPALAADDSAGLAAWREAHHAGPGSAPVWRTDTAAWAQSHLEIAEVLRDLQRLKGDKELVESKKHDAVICLGALLRGETPHFDYIASTVTRGIGSASLESGIPVIYGVLTCNTVEQAIERAGLKSGNKGFDAAMAAVEMVQVMKQL